MHQAWHRVLHTCIQVSRQPGGKFLEFSYHTDEEAKAVEAKSYGPCHTSEAKLTLVTPCS